MSIRVTCPGCGRTGRVPDSSVGKTLKCPACGVRHRLEAEASPSVGPEPREAPSGAEGLEILDEPSGDHVLDPLQENPGPSGSSSGRLCWEHPIGRPEGEQEPPTTTSSSLAPLYMGLGAGAVIVLAFVLVLLIASPFRREKAGPEATVSTPTSAIAAAPEPWEKPRIETVDATPAQPLSTAEIVAQSEPSIALIRGKASSGTGFFVGPGLLATNAHVVDGEFIRNLEIRFPSADDAHKGPIPAELLYEDAQRDLAFLAVKTTLPPLRVAQSFRYRKGEDVTVIGNPGIGDGGTVLENAISRGVMSTKAEIEGQKFYQLGIAVNPGNSGGPVLDSPGCVIGVVTLRIPDKQGLSFCIPVEELRAGMDKLRAQAPGDIAAMRSRHRLVIAFKNLSSAGAIYGISLELHLVQDSNPRDSDLDERVKKIDAAVPELEQTLSANLAAESNALRKDALVVAMTRIKMGELADNYLKLKAAFDRDRATTSLDAIRTMKSTHRRLIDALKTDLKIDVPEGLLAALEDHVVTGPALAINPSAPVDPADRVLRRAFERHGMVMPPIPRPPNFSRGPRFGPRGRLGR